MMDLKRLMGWKDGKKRKKVGKLGERMDVVVGCCMGIERSGLSW